MKSDYINLFIKYDLKRSDIYMLSETRIDDIYMLFDEIIDMLCEDSSINKLLPNEFINTAKRYNENDLITHLHFSLVSNRAFMLSDLIDFLALIKSKPKN